jgi:mannose-6-phosphate isomerase-like protein (cupin superfamily)
MKILHNRYASVTPYTTKDASQIRELMHPAHHGSQQQSLAEAIVQPGKSTTRHRHLKSEELYFILQGEGLMTLGDEKFEVRVQDTVCIPPGTPHCIKNTGDKPLHILCACSPPYSHEDTELLV